MDVDYKENIASYNKTLLNNRQSNKLENEHKAETAQDTKAKLINCVIFTNYGGFNESKNAQLDDYSIHSLTNIDNDGNDR